MDDVRTTVQTALRSRGYDQYINYAEPVITVLENRERDISGVLIEYATGRGLSRAEVEQTLQHAGLVVPAAPQAEVPRPVPGTAASAEAQNAGSSDPVLEALRRIEGRLDGLTRFARDNGYTG